MNEKVRHTYETEQGWTQSTGWKRVPWQVEPRRLKDCNCKHCLHELFIFAGTPEPVIETILRHYVEKQPEDTQ